MNFVYLLSFLIFFAFSCSTAKEVLKNQKIKGHNRLYSFPDKIIKPMHTEDRYRRLVFVSSNDFNGKNTHTSISIKNRFAEKRQLSIGGIVGMKAYLNIFRSQFPDELIYIDAGSYLGKKKDHKLTGFYFDYLAPDVIALGKGELLLDTSQDVYMDYIEKITKEMKTPILTSNLFDLRKAENLNLTNVFESKIIEKNKIKIGFISVFEQKTSSLVPDKNINGLYIQDELKTILNKSKKLRQQGAQIVTLLYQGELDCTSILSHKLDLPPKKTNFEVKKSAHCNTFNNTLAKVLNQIPSGTVDLVFVSGNKLKVANFINNIPVLQNFGNGEYLSWLEFFYDTKHEAIEKKKTLIHQPVQLCHQFLKDSQDCYIDEKNFNIEVIEAKFLNQRVEIGKLPLMTK